MEGNKPSDPALEVEMPNIINISSDEKRVANDGTINYTERFIQREKASLEQAAYVTNASVLDL